MRRRIDIRFLLLFMLLCATTAFSQTATITKTGTTAASFLKLGVGARAVGMGAAFTSVADDISAIYWNPAGLARMKTNEAVFNHIDWIADIKYDMAAAALTIEGIGTLGISFTAMNVGEMDVTTTSFPEGTGEKFTAGGTLINLSYARNLTDLFSIGFNAKLIRESIWNMSAQAFSIDIGTMYTAPIFNGITIGASISNFGPKMKLEGRDNVFLVKTGASNDNIINGTYELDSYDLPLLFRVGISTNAVQSENTRVTLAVDAVHPNDNTEYLNSGIEYSWANIISVRGGWKSAFERGTEQGLTFGAGVQYEVSSQLNFILDYAYQDFGRLKSVNYFSFGLRF